jgi:hypothetical protein
MNILPSLIRSLVSPLALAGGSRYGTPAGSSSGTWAARTDAWAGYAR